MRLVHVSLAAGLGIIAAPGVAQAQAVSFSKDIVPIMKEQCVKCHSARQPAGGFAVSSFAAIEKGGKGGKLLAAKAEESRLVKLLEGTAQPKMPPGAPLKKEQIEKIKLWINQGAKADVAPDAVVIPDSAIPPVKVPVIKPKVPLLPQVGALTWSTDNKILAIGTYKVVRLVDPANGQTIRELKDHSDVIHSLQFSPDGKLLAAAGGPPAQQGEVKIWEVATGNLVRTILGHNDYIYSCSWSPDSKTLATASYDKLIKIWDVSNGTELKTLKDHADAVYAVAFSPDGNLLASGSADRSVKMWDVKTGKRIYTLSGHGDIVFSLAWNKAGNQLTSTGADKTMRTWNVNPQAGNQARSVGAGDRTVNEVVYSMDGTLLATVSDDKTLRVFNANGQPTQNIKDNADSMLSVAISPDNKLVAGGGFDGTVKIFNVADGKLVSTVIDLPKAPAPAAPAAPAAKPDPKAAPAKPEPKKTEAKPGAKKS